MTMPGIPEGEQVPKFNCVRDESREINRIENPVPMAGVLHQGIEACWEQFLLITKSKSWIHSHRIFTQSLFESRIFLSPFPLLYRVYHRENLSESTSQCQMIHEVIGPGVIHPSYAYDIKTFAQTLSYILLLTLRILA
jgi:hypothetical protein